jgi:hypothetical protein
VTLAAVLARFLETELPQDAPKAFVARMRERVKLPVRSVGLPLFLSILMAAPLVQAQTPSTPTPAQVPVQTNPSAAPPPPLPPDEYKNLSEITVELYYWKQTSHPQMRPGLTNVDGDSSTLGSGVDLLGKSKAAEGILVTTPAGRANLLEFEYFQTKQQGNETAGENLILFGQPYNSGDLLVSATKIQHARVTWSYLTYPDPPGAHKFRFRTLYGFEYTTMTARFDAPLDQYASPVEGTRSIIFPSLGVGADYHFSKRFSFTSKAEGFAWPHKAVQTDADARFLFRVYKQLDVVAGYKYFHFKTNPEKDYFLKATMQGPYAALRWTFK